MRSPRFIEVLILSVIILILADLKLTYNISTISPGIDGGFYTDIAQHVRDGDGLKTDISLYHQGFEYFPHPTNIYPLWPWVYGFAARFSNKPILVTGVNLATFFFFLSLIFGYLWANEVFRKPLFTNLISGFKAGHVLVLMLASHTAYFVHTSRPYTEGIAYAILFAGLWRSAYLLKKGGLAQGFELGIWLGLIYSSRYQLIITAMAVFPAMIGACFWHPNRKRALQMLVACTLSFGAILGAYYMHGGRIPIRFQSHSGMLSRLEGSVHVNTISAYIVDRAKGFIVAFSPKGSCAYSLSYRLFHYSLIISVPFFFLEISKHKLKKILSELTAIVHEPRTTFLVFVILFSIGGWISIHMLHPKFSVDWYFGHRWGLTCLPLFFLTMIYLLSRKKFWPVFLGVFLLGTSTVMAYVQYSAEAKNADMNAESFKQIRLSEKPPSNQELVQFILEERSNRDKLTVVWSASQPQLMALYIPDVGFHWIYHKTKLEDIITMFDVLNADYLLFAPEETVKWKFRQNQQMFDNEFDRVNSFSGFDVYVRKVEKMNKTD